MSDLRVSLTSSSLDTFLEVKILPRQSLHANCENRSLLAYALILVSKLLHDELVFEVTIFW